SCYLCAAPSRSALLCRACHATLPRLSATGCPLCALPTRDGSVCGRCLQRTPAFDATVAVHPYAFPVDELVQALKYGGRLALAELARTLKKAGAARVENWVVARTLPGKMD